jgi:hypothetical protein
MQPGQLSQYSDYATGWKIQGSNPNKGKIFALAQNVQTGSRMGNTRSLPRDKAPKHEADHSTPSTTKGKNEWSHISNPPTSWHAQRYLSLYFEGQTDINVGGKKTICGHINVTNFLTTIQSKARQVIADRPDDGCIAETCSLVLLT